MKLTYLTESNAIRDDAGILFSLAETSPWERFPWSKDQISEANLGDLACRRLDTSALLNAVWLAGKNGARLRFRLPHPRHDLFASHLDYVRPLLPAAFARLSQFELVQTALELDPHWQCQVDRGEVTYDQIGDLSRQICNVITWFTVDLEIRKVVPISPRLTDAMRAQLTEQIELQRLRGNEDAVTTIERFLEADHAQ